MKRLSIVVFVTAVLSMAAQQVFGDDVYFNDGATHNVDYAVNGNVSVDYQTPDMYTTVNVLPGASIPDPYTLYGYKNSTINVQGGNVNTIETADSQCTVSSGTVAFIEAGFHSQIAVSGGSVKSLLAWDNTDLTLCNSVNSVCWVSSGHLNFEGGSVNTFVNMGAVTVSNWPVGSFINRGNLTLVDGTYSSFLTEGGRLTMLGGCLINPILGYGNIIAGGTIIGDLSDISFTMTNGTIDGDVWTETFSPIISGGTINGNLHATDCGPIILTGGLVTGNFISDGCNSIISGGKIEGNLIAATADSITISGANFAIDGTPIGNGSIGSILSGNYADEPLRRLTGTLLNGDPLDCQIQIGDGASIDLVPEPATLLLIGLGGAMLRKR
jgi:hypothetical protein